MDLPTALQVLDFDRLPTVAELEGRYLELAKKRHPDGGGSAQGFIDLTDARNRISSELSKVAIVPTSEAVSGLQQLVGQMVPVQQAAQSTAERTVAKEESDQSTRNIIAHRIADLITPPEFARLLISRGVEVGVLGERILDEDGFPEIWFTVEAGSSVEAHAASSPF